MNYIYDLVLNWSDNKLFEFFEWDENDEIEYIKKIPVFKVCNFNEIKDICFKVYDDFLKKIYFKTEVYGNKKVDTVEYCCIFCNEVIDEAIAFEFDAKGECIYRSSINFFDIDDLYDCVKDSENIKLKYKELYKYNNNHNFLTRNEIKKRNFILNEINNAFINNNGDKLRYLYYEFFGKLSDDFLSIKDKLVKYLTLDINIDIDKIYNCVNNTNIF